MESKVTKSPQGTFIEAEIELGIQGAEGPYYLTITTMKRYSGKIVAIASAKQRTAMGFMCMPFSDYNKPIAQAEGRATIANLQQVQAVAMAKVEEIKADALEFYSKAEVA